MGQNIQQAQFTATDHERFNHKIRDNLRALEQLLDRPGFGVGADSLGAELEFYLVDEQGRPAPYNRSILDAYSETQAKTQASNGCQSNLTPELNKFNLEYNLHPQAFKGTPFLQFRQELAREMAAVNTLAQSHQAELIPIGILPTLRLEDFGQHAMTELPRYQVMDQALRRLRGAPFNIDIDGPEPLHLEWDDVTLEGANTSLQIHWRINPEQFAGTFNAIQLLTPVVLGLAANSPYLFGHQLWEETRIALFKQSIDCREATPEERRYPARVYFGHGWIHSSALELFASTVTLFPPIMPVCSEQDPLQALQQNQLPELNELKLHQGTTWPWNRAVYDHHEGGHIRIEMRALPAGPSLEDMNANAAFLLGSALALRDSMVERTRLLPFRLAESNFYRAAQYGLDAELVWPSSSKIKLVDYPLLELAERLLPLARDALLAHGMAAQECKTLMSNIQHRIEQRINGSRWQTQMTSRFEHQGLSRQQALSAMFQQYRQQFRGGLSISEWGYD